MSFLSRQHYLTITAIFAVLTAIAGLLTHNLWVMLTIGAVGWVPLRHSIRRRNG